jgi:tetratricopeptide (TPR) repeat protein
LASAPETSSEASTLDLTLMYAGNSASAPHALKLAQHEFGERQDVWTMDAYAWALYANGRYPDADAAIQKALAVGIQSAQIFDHAGHIAQKLGHAADASRYFGLALQANPSSEYARDARKSAGLTGVTEIGEAPASTTSANVPVSTADERHNSAPDTDVSNHNATYANASGHAPASAFAPVPNSLLASRPTGTESMIHNAQTLVARAPKDATGYARLGAAYFQRARETGDVSDYELAEQSLTKSLNLASDDFSSEAALETLAEVCMGEHRFTDALTYAQEALSLGTGELSPFAIVGDAYADMGEYDKAAAAYSRLTPRDMTPSPRAAYARDSRVSYLKFISGDTAGAIALMKTAVAEGLQTQLPAENLAWLYYELGEYCTQAGDAPAADAAYLAALNIHPGDYRALAALGKLRANVGRYADAIKLYQKAIAIVPMPIFVAELGDLYVKSGNQPEAQKQFALVEYIGLLGRINRVLHNRDLAIFYADHDMKLSEALDLAQKEIEVRRDVYTWDALAWALYKNGKLNEAAEASGKALHFGTRDPLLLFHAGMIAEGLGRDAQARSELKQALEINPHFHPIYADEAQQRLDALEEQSKTEEGLNQHGR